MLTNSVYYILNMSIMAAVVIVSILLLRLFFEKWVSKSILVLFWIVVLLRLIIPFSVESHLSIGNLLGESIIREVGTNGQVLEDNDSMDIIISNYVKLADDYKPVRFNNLNIMKWFNILGIIWLTGAIFMFIYCLTVLYIMRRLKKYGKEVTHIVRDVLDMDYKGNKTHCYLSDKVSTPMVVGIIKPYIVLPNDFQQKLTTNQLSLVLKHEYAHISRKDNLLKLIFGVGLCLHWFNPFVWYMNIKISKDIEFACDEKVLKGASTKDRKDYVLALVECASKRKVYGTAFGPSNLKERVLAIINYKKKSMYMMGITGFLCVVMAIVLITNPTI